jgi:hypothetical protein
MRLGINLPGPFRVGISSKGRISAGMNLGPLSVSGGVGGRRQRTSVGQQQGAVMAYMTLEEAVADALTRGWKVSYHRPGQSAFLVRGWSGASMRAVPGGVLMRPTMSNRTALLIGLVTILGVLACCLGPALLNRR